MSEFWGWEMSSWQMTHNRVIICTMENNFPIHCRHLSLIKVTNVTKWSNRFFVILVICNEDENKGGGSEKRGNQQTVKKGWLMGGGGADWGENGCKEVEERGGWRKGGGGGRERGGEGIRIIFHLWQCYTFQQLQRCLQKDLPPLVQGLCPCLHWALWKVLKITSIKNSTEFWCCSCHVMLVMLCLSFLACPIVYNKPLIFFPDFRKLEPRHTRTHSTGMKKMVANPTRKTFILKKKHVKNIFFTRHYYFFMKEHHLMEVQINLQMISLSRA